jgi:hypothetical protein
LTAAIALTAYGLVQDSTAVSGHQDQHIEELQHGTICSTTTAAAEQLGDTAFHETLISSMPCLEEDEGSLASTAQSCKQMRDQLYRGTQKLCVPNQVLQEPATMERFPERFCGCQQMTFELSSIKDLTCHLPTALSSLTR